MHGRCHRAPSPQRRGFSQSACGWPCLAQLGVVQHCLLSVPLELSSCFVSSVLACIQSLFCPINGKREETKPQLLELRSKSREQDILHCNFQFFFSFILSCLFFSFCLGIFQPPFICYYFLSLPQSSGRAAGCITGPLLGSVLWPSTLAPEEVW